MIEALEPRTLLSVTPTVTAVPDVTLTGATKTASTVSLTLTNDATAAHGKVTVNLYESTDQTLDGGDVLINSVVKNISLAANGVKTIKVPLGTIPNSITPGNDFIIADVVGADVSGGESSAASNSTVAFVQSPVSLSDAVVLNSGNDITAQPGAVLNYTLTITNSSGTLAHGKVPIAIDATTSVNGSPPVTVTVGTIYENINLRAGASKTFSLKFAVPGTLAEATYTFSAIVDPNSTFGTETTNSAAAASTFLVAGSTYYAPAVTQELGGFDPYSVVLADVNGDGNLDMITTDYSHGDDNVSVLLGNGNGTFGNATTYDVGTGPVGLAVGDVNGDTDPDIVVANFASNNVSVLLNNGDGTFGTQTTYATGNGPTNVALVDLNGDGAADIVTTNYTDGTVSVLLNNNDGTGTFGAQTAYAAGAGTFGLAVGDFDGDGNMDIATTNVTDSTVSVLLGVGNGTLGTQTTYNVGFAPHGIAAGVLTSSGNTDLVVANTGTFGTPGDTVSVLLGAGDGTFGQQTVFSTGASGKAPASIQLADLDGDGNLDLVTSNYVSNTVTTMLGNGDGTFQPAQSYAVGHHPSSVAVGNLNSDSLPDLVATNEGGTDTASILLAARPQVTPTVTGVPTTSLVSGAKTNKTVKVTLTDTGAVAAKGPVTVALYASTDQTLDGGDTLITSVTKTVNLSVDKSMTFAVPLGTIPSLAASNYFIIANATGIPVDTSVSQPSSTEITVVAPAVVGQPAAIASSVSVPMGVFNSDSVITALPTVTQPSATTLKNKALAAI